VVAFVAAHPMAIAIVIEVFVLLYLLRPLLWSAYSGDDVPLSQTPMWRELSGASLGEDIGATNRFWMDEHGRLFPMWITWSFSVFTVIQTRVAYKVFQLFMILLAWGLFVGFVRMFTRSNGYAVFAGASSIMFMQFRYFHDPMLQFATHQPLLMSLFFGSLLSILAAHRAHSTRAFVGFTGLATVLWSLGLLTYETLYPLVLIPLGLAALKMDGTRRRAVIGSIGGATALLLLAVFIVRSGTDVTDPEFTMGLAPADVIPALAKQLSGLIPFSYQVFGSTDGIPGLLSGWSIGGRWDLAFLVAAVALVWILVRHLEIRRLERLERLFLLGTGALMVLAPSGIIAVTRRWQIGEVDWGTPYVSVFTSTFGILLLLLVAADGLARLPDRSIIRRAAVWGGVVALVFGPIVIADTNAAVVDRFSPLRFEREVFAEAASTGAFDQVPDGSIVVAEEASTWFWVNGAFVAWHGGPSNLQFLRPDDPALADCGQGSTCFRYFRYPTPAVTDFEGS